ncbi:MAG: hypothetical protein IJX38_01870 [Clostridia bacterium]|nr:hypothetical protein [Clostridia bacterium]
MARKSKETLLKERLASLGTCPYDIFEILPESEEIFSLIAEAERGNISSAERIIDALLPEAIKAGRPNAALLHYVSITNRAACTSAAKKYISYFLSIHGGYDVAAEAIRLILDSDGPLGTVEGLAEARLRLAVHEAEDASDPLTVLAPISDIDVTLYAPVALYIYSLGAKGGRCVCHEDMLDAAGLPHIKGLFPYCHAVSSTVPDEEEALHELGLMRENLYRYPAEGWRDFWLRCMYEMTLKYLSGRLEIIAEDVIQISEERRYCDRHSRHTLAWLKYLLKHSADPEQAEWAADNYSKIYARCAFEGGDADIDENELEQLMKEAVYVSSRDELMASTTARLLGSRITHERNRFKLSATLEGHGKRGRMHFWNAPLSIDSSYLTAALPAISRLSVVEAHNDVCRGGTTLEHDKAKSQLICYAELDTGGSKHPFEIDLILDIAYISAVKCSEGEIRIKEHTERCGHTVMECQILLY